MRNMFALIGVLVVGFGGAGWYLGWYKVNVTKNADGNLQIQTNVDTKKVSGDSSEFFQKVSQMVNDKVQQASQNAAAPSSPLANAPGPLANGTLTLPISPAPAAPPPPALFPNR
jgi:hypothetical protein